MRARPPRPKLSNKEKTEDKDTGPQCDANCRVAHEKAERDIDNEAHEQREHDVPIANCVRASTGGSRYGWCRRGAVPPASPAGGSAADASLCGADGAGERAAALWLEEERDADLGEHEVGDDHYGQDCKEGERERLEAEQVSERRDIGEGDAEGGAGEGSGEQRAAGTALVEGNAAGADHEDDECSCRLGRRCAGGQLGSR